MIRLNISTSAGKAFHHCLFSFCTESCFSCVSLSSSLFVSQLPVVLRLGFSVLLTCTCVVHAQCLTDLPSRVTDCRFGSDHALARMESSHNLCQQQQVILLSSPSSLPSDILQPTAAHGCGAQPPCTNAAKTVPLQNFIQNSTTHYIADRFHDFCFSVYTKFRVLREDQKLTLEKSKLTIPTVMCESAEERA